MKKTALLILLLILLTGTAFADGLLYRQKFDAVSKFSELEWNGIDSSAASCKISDGRLAVSSYSKGQQYTCILPPEKMKDFTADTYTVQYTVNYDTTTDSAGFISLLLGSKKSGVLPVLNARGKARIYSVKNGKLTTLETVSAAGILPKNKKNFSGVQVTMRVTVEKSGHMALAMQAKGGKWTELINVQTSVPDGLYLAVSGKHKGSIDNILVYNGTQKPSSGETPSISYRGNCQEHEWTAATCEAPETCVLCGKTRGGVIPHRFEGDGEDSLCLICGRTRDAIENNWLLDGVPAYEGGVKAKALYNAGQGTDKAQPAEKDCYLQAVSGTDAEEYVAYLNKLSSKGYTLVTRKKKDGNRFADAFDGKNLLHTIFTQHDGAVKVIRDTASDCAAAEFGYSCEGSKQTAIYQVGLPMNENGYAYGRVNKDGTVNRKIDCGMMYVIRLSDNSLMLIDGGSYKQFDDAQIDSVMNFLRRITGGGEEKIRIACWFITHPHNDHYSGMCRLLAKYHDSFELERVMCNFPGVNTDEYLSVYRTGGMLKLFKYLDQYFGSGYRFLKCHTGQHIELADISMDVLYTHEENIDVSTGKSLITSDENNACSVLMLNVCGKKFLLCGDINRAAAEVMLKLWKTGTLKSDIVQLAHHGINLLGSLYKKTAPEMVLAPVSYNGAHRTQERKKSIGTLEKTADAVFYAADGTAGITVFGGELAQVFSLPVAGGDYLGWSW